MFEETEHWRSGAATSKNGMTLLRIVSLINTEWPSETSHRRRSVFSAIAHDSKLSRQQIARDSWNFQTHYSNCHLSLPCHYLNTNEFSKLYTKLIYSILFFLFFFFLHRRSIVIPRQNLFHSSILQPDFRRSKKKKRNKKKKKKQWNEKSLAIQIHRIHNTKGVTEAVEKPGESIRLTGGSTNFQSGRFTRRTPDTRLGVTIFHFRAPRYPFGRARLERSQRQTPATLAPTTNHFRESPLSISVRSSPNVFHRLRPANFDQLTRKPTGERHFPASSTYATCYATSCFP